MTVVFFLLAMSCTNLDGKKLPGGKSRLSFKISGGGSYFIIGDLNSHSRGITNRVIDTLGALINGDNQPIHLGFNVEFSIQFNFLPRFGISAGAGFVHAKKMNQSSLQIQSYSMDVTHSPRIKAIPVNLSLFAYPFKHIYINAGVDYYFAQCSYRHRFQIEDQWLNNQGNARGQGIGLHGKIGYEIPISKHFVFIIEAVGRLAKIKNLTGTRELSSSGGTTTTIKGALYAYEETRNGATYTLVTISDEAPAGVKNVRKAMLNLCGSSLSAGLKIRF